jgi:hypothetical protein
MSSVSVAGDSSGSILLAAPAVAGSSTLTLPTGGGTVMATGTMPTFSANNNASTYSISNATYTQAQFPTKAWDTSTAYNNTGSTVTLNGLSVPAYSFCPPVAGYYQINGCVAVYSSSVGRVFASIYKNGVGASYGVAALFNGTYQTEAFAAANSILYLNGTGDYIQYYIYQNSGSTLTVDYGSGYTYFNACLLRSA